MRQVHFSKPLPAEEEAPLLIFWAFLSSNSTLLSERAIYQQLVDDQARFALSLARQYQSPEVGAETLLASAHDSLVTFLNQFGTQPDTINRHLAHVLRESVIQLTTAGKRLES